MENNETRQAVLYLIDKVDYFWNRLYVSTSVLISFAIGHELLKLQLITLILLSLVYIIYWAGNLLDHVRAYRFLNTLLDDVKNATDDISNDSLMDMISKLPYKREQYLCIAAYILALGIVITITYLI